MAKKMLEKYILSLIMTVFFSPLVLTSHNYVTEFEDSSSPGGESVDDLAFHLIVKCFTNTDRLITLSGNVSEKLVSKIYKSEFTAVTLITYELPSIDEIYTMAKQSRPLYENQFYFRFEHKARGFILAGASHSILRRQIKELKNSRWWKAQGLFVIMGDGTSISDSCENAQRFLWLAWRSNILSSVFLCHDTNERPMMYSYNPYNSLAPKNWLKVGQYFGHRGHPWILFKRNASYGTAHCGEIFFDKTKTLDNYEVRSNAQPLKPRLLMNYNKTGVERYEGEEGIALQSVFRFLNASIADVPYTGRDPFGYFDDNGTYFGMLSDVFTGRVDIGMNGRYMVKMWKLGMSYPYTTAQICFVVKSRGDFPQWMNILYDFDLWIQSGLTIAILLTAGVLSYYGSVSSAFLNSLRLVISTSLIRLPSHISARLFLISVLLMFVIINGTFQGRLVSLLTKPRAYRNPETQTDLGRAGYDIVGYPPILEFIDDPVLRSNFRPSMSMECIERILTGEYITCTVDCEAIHIFHSSHNIQLHTLSQRLNFYITFATSLDWPLLDRFNELMMRLTEAGFPGYWKAEAKRISIVRNYRDGSSHRKDRSPALSLADLAFMFHWLLFGLLVATLVFFYEVASVWYKRKFNRIRTAL